MAAWQPPWISDRNDFSYCWPTSHPNASYQVLSQLAQGCRGSRLLKQLLTPHDGRWTLTTTIAHHVHFVLRWANKLWLKVLKLWFEHGSSAYVWNISFFSKAVHSWHNKFFPLNLLCRFLHAFIYTFKYLNNTVSVDSSQRTFCLKLLLLFGGCTSLQWMTQKNVLEHDKT